MTTCRAPAAIARWNPPALASTTGLPSLRSARSGHHQPDPCTHHTARSSASAAARCQCCRRRHRLGLPGRGAADSVEEKIHKLLDGELAILVNVRGVEVVHHGVDGGCVHDLPLRGHQTLELGRVERAVLVLVEKHERLAQRLLLLLQVALCLHALVHQRNELRQSASRAGGSDNLVQLLLSRAHPASAHEGSEGRVGRNAFAACGARIELLRVDFFWGSGR
mmetsp:Transcript_60255/g.134267  ORF Transcript_60255/g.134267 Transcript_60255/m.134267 type:complete len:222 (+) Transcript_60255:184-849(+)